MSKKKSKGVLKQIGEVIAAGAETVVDAGSKAVHAVGDMMPGSKPAPKRSKSKPKAKKAIAVKKAAAKTTKKAAPSAASKAKAPKKSAKSAAARKKSAKKPG